LKHLVLLMCAILNFSYLSANILKNISVADENKSFKVIYEFDSNVDAKNINVEYINQTIQLNLQNAEFKNGKSNIKIGRSDVKSLYTYQNKKDLLRSRIIYNKPFKANDFEGYVDIKVDGRFVELTVLDPKIDLPVVLPEKVVTLKVEPSDISKIDDKVLTLEKNQTTKSLEDEALKIINDEFKITRTNKDKVDSDKVVNTKVVDNKKNKNALSSALGLKNINNLNENEIPVFGKAKEKTSSTNSVYSRIFISLGVLLAFALGMVVYSKKMLNKKRTQSDTTKIKVLTQHYLGPKKSLTMVSVAGETMLLGVTDQNINFIKSISLIDDEYASDMPKNFKSEMEQELNQKLEAVVDRNMVQRSPVESVSINNTERNQFSEDMDEEFSVSKIANLVSSKLKNMRQI